jgi:hypothetical protein
MCWGRAKRRDKIKIEGVQLKRKKEIDQAANTTEPWVNKMTPSTHFTFPSFIDNKRAGGDDCGMPDDDVICV